MKNLNPFKHQFHKIIKHTQTIRRQIADELFLSVFDHFVGLALKGLMQSILNLLLHPLREKYLIT